MGETVNSELYLSYLALSVVSALFLHCVHKRYDAAFKKGTPLPAHRYVAPASYAAFSAIFGAQSVVQAKCLAYPDFVLCRPERARGLQGFGNMFLNYWTYVTLFAWVFFVAVWLYRMNEALGLYDPIFIIPLLQAGFIIFAIISGGIYFGEFSRFEPGHWLFFCFGNCLRLRRPAAVVAEGPRGPETGGHTTDTTADERPGGGRRAEDADARFGRARGGRTARRSPSLDGSPKARRPSATGRRRGRRPAPPRAASASRGAARRGGSCRTSPSRPSRRRTTSGARAP